MKLETLINKAVLKANGILLIKGFTGKYILIRDLSNPKQSNPKAK